MRFSRYSMILLILLIGTSGARANQGVVTDAKSHAVIPGATITIGKQALVTDDQGRFNYEQTSGTVMARAPGYRASRIDSALLQKQDGVLQLDSFVPKALYLTVYGIGSKSLREGALTLIKHGRVNALVIDVKGDRGLIPYPSANPLAQKSGARAITTIRNLPALIAELHQSGIYTIARIVVFKDNPLATSRPDFAVKQQNGSLFRDREGLAWVDPFQAEVREYNINIAIEAAQAGFDEIQFDYVRFPDVSQKLRFAGDATEASRVEGIDRFLMEAHDRLTPYNVFVAVDVFGYICWNTNDTGIGQQLEHISKLVDYLSPMVYPSGYKFGIPGCSQPVSHPYEIVRSTLENARKRVNISPKRFRPWLQGFRDYAFDHRVFGAAELAEQVRAADDFGSDGWMLWNPRNRYEGLGLELPAPVGTDQAH